MRHSNQSRKNEIWTLILPSQFLMNFPMWFFKPSPSNFVGRGLLTLPDCLELITSSKQHIKSSVWVYLACAYCVKKVIHVACLNRALSSYFSQKNRLNELIEHPKHTLKQEGP